MMWFANAVAWIATSVGVVAGMYITKSAWCLWAFFYSGFDDVRIRKHLY